MLFIYCGNDRSRSPERDGRAFRILLRQRSERFHDRKPIFSRLHVSRRLSDGVVTWISFHLMSVLAPPGFIAHLFERWWMDEPLNDRPSYSVLAELVRQSHGGAANINKLCRHQTSVDAGVGQTGPRPVDRLLVWRSCLISGLSFSINRFRLEFDAPLRTGFTSKRCYKNLWSH